MQDHQTIGPVPCNEDCQQVGTPSYDHAKAKLECETFKAQLERTFKNPPVGASIGIMSFPHDFGTYMEVVVFFDDEIEAAMDYMLEVEGDTPEEWDEESKKALGIS